MRSQPYASKGPRPVGNAQDGIYGRGGQQLLIATNAVADGYSAVFDIGLQVD